MHCTSSVLFVNFNELRLHVFWGVLLVFIASGILVNEIYLLLSSALSMLFSVWFPTASTYYDIWWRGYFVLSIKHGCGGIAYCLISCSSSQISKPSRAFFCVPAKNSLAIKSKTAMAVDTSQNWNRLEFYQHFCGADLIMHKTA